MSLIPTDVHYESIDRNQAEAKLRQQPAGSYIYKDGARVGHMLLQCKDSQWFADGVQGRFKSCNELLKALPYKLNVDPPVPAVVGGGRGGGGGGGGGRRTSETYDVVPSGGTLSADAPTPGYSRVPQGTSNSLLQSTGGGGGGGGGGDGYGRVPDENPAEPGYGRVPLMGTGSDSWDPRAKVRTQKITTNAMLAQYGKVPETSVTVNLPLQLVKQSLALMGDRAAFKSFTRKLREHLENLTEGKVKAAVSTPVYTEMVNLGRTLTIFHAELTRITQTTPPNAPDSVWQQAVEQSKELNSKFISLQLQLLSLRAALDATRLGATSGYNTGQSGGSTSGLGALPSLAGLGASGSGGGGGGGGGAARGSGGVALPASSGLGMYSSVPMKTPSPQSSGGVQLPPLPSSYAKAISSKIGADWWTRKMGAQNNTVSWNVFFRVLQDTLDIDLQSREAFVKFMFDCNNENVISTQSFNMFVCWFDYDGMKAPTKIKDFLLTLISRAEEIFFFDGFHGFKSRTAADRMLSGLPPSTYLIRLSDSNAGVFILSYVTSSNELRHRLLNQVSKPGFMIESKAFNTLPEMLAAHAGALRDFVPNSIKFEATPTSEIYGGGADLRAEISRLGAGPPIMEGQVHYHVRIVLNKMWPLVTLELRETELTVVTSKTPLRRSWALGAEVQSVAKAAPTAASATSAPANEQVFELILVDRTVLAFSSPQADQWVTAIKKALKSSSSSSAAKAADSSKMPTTKLGKAMRSAVMGRASEDDGNQLKEALLSAARHAGQLADVDEQLIEQLNAHLAARAKKKKKKLAPPKISVSKLEIDMNLAGATCEAGVPVRDSVTMRNEGDVPVQVTLYPPRKEALDMKFLPDTFELGKNSSQVIDIVLTVNSGVKVEELMHCGVGSGSLFFILQCTAKLSEALEVDKIDRGPKLGAGAFGSVYHGTYKGREVAVKIVSFEPDYDQEMNILRSMQPHPNIVKYIGAAKMKPFQGFIVLEFMELGSLDKYIHNKSYDLDIPLCLRIAEDVAQGLCHLHRCKIMHLDLKPANVLVVNMSVHAPVCTKLADFGLSQVRDTSETFKGEYVEGTLLYMAPEMLKAKIFSFRGDVFSFAMTLWEMMVREMPYSGPKHRHLKKPEFEVCREQGELPSDLNDIRHQPSRELIRQMFDVDHERRPSSEQVLLEIQRIRRGMVAM